MWGLLRWGGAIGLLVLLLAPQWRSFERMGEARFATLDRAGQEILVGVSWPFKANQDGMAQGLELALDEINASLPAGEPPLRLVLRDDGDDWDQARAIARDFAATPGMSAVLGYHGDAVAIQASAVYEQSRLLHLVLGAGATALTSRGNRYVVRTVPPADRVATALAGALAALGRKPGKVALVWEDSSRAKDLSYQYKIALNALGGAVVYQWGYSRDSADFREPVNVMTTLDLDAIFFVGPDGLAGDFLRMARKVGLAVPILGAFEASPELRRRAGTALDGVVTADFFDAAASRPETIAFVGKFRARYGRDPDRWAAQGYDGLYLLARSLRSSGSANPLDLAFALRFMPEWDGAGGRYGFDGRGELTGRDLVLKVFRGGTASALSQGTAMPPAIRQ